MVTGSSPEPLIAEASAQIMHSSIGGNGNEKMYMNVWDLLVKFVDEGLVPQGTIGELIGRVLSIAAMDRAIHALTEHYELKYQTPVTVAAYFKALLTDEAWERGKCQNPAFLFPANLIPKLQPKNPHCWFLHPWCHCLGCLELKTHSKIGMMVSSTTDYLLMEC